MSGLIDSAQSIISSAENRLQSVAQNIANTATPGFKKQASFTQALDQASGPENARQSTQHYLDFSQGRLTETGNPLDLAIHGPGLLMLRDGETFTYSRGGHFAIGPDGVIQDGEGRILQQAGGGDLSVKSAAVEFLDDGTVLEAGLPVAQLGLYEASTGNALSALGGSLFAADPSAMTEAVSSQVRQGFTESSNVVASDEMIAMMAAVRQAESGARVAQFYDQLVGQAISTFSRNSR